MKIDRFTIIIAVSSLALISLLIYLIGTLFQFRFALPRLSSQTPKPRTLSPYILYLTSPVYSFTGTIGSVGRNEFDIGVEIDPSLLIGVTATPSATGQKVKVSYQVEADSQTQISQPQVLIPFLYKEIQTTQPTSLSLADLRPGDQVTVFTTIDLRIVQDNRIKATQIQRNITTTTVSGTITSVSGNTIQVRSEITGVITATPQPPLTYSVTIKPDAEIVKLDPVNPQRISIGQLEVGNQVIIYSASMIISGGSVTAEKVDVIPTTVSPITPPPPPAVTTPGL